MLKYQSTIDFIKNLYPNQDFIPLHEPRFIGNEKKYVLETIDSTFVSSVGEFVNEFERKMQTFTGANYAIAVVNGTAALHIGLLLAGVKKDDIVITQALSFVATCNAISYTGAVPGFVDVDLTTTGMSVASLKTFLTNVELVDGIPFHKPTGRRVGACVPMHTFGFPVEIDEIVKLCEAYNINVVEDAAESLGSYYKGKHTGTFGKVGTFSFNGNKTITSGGGGILVTNDEDLAKKAKHLTTTAKIPHKWEFVHDSIGYNYRCPNLNAALAVAQLEQLSSFIKNKRETATLYTRFFDKIEMKHLQEQENAKANYWLNAVQLPSKEERNQFLTELNENGVMSRPIWSLMTKLEMFKDAYSENLSNSIFLEETIVNIPSSVRV